MSRSAVRPEAVRPKIVITGCSAIGPHGYDLEVLGDALREGRPLCGPLPEALPFTTPRRSQECATCPEMDLTEWVPARAARRMSMPSQWVVATGRMALAAADWHVDTRDGDEGQGLAVCIATCFGPSDFTRRLLLQIFQEGPKAASPFYFTDCVANAPCGQLAIAVGARAANAAISQREAGPLMSLIHARNELANGRARAVLAGAVDECDQLQISILDAMRALAPDREHVRPLDRRRCGILLGAGASALVLETVDAAVDRGAPILARVAFATRAFDPSAPRANWGSGHDTLGRRLRDGLHAAGIAPDSIDAVVSGASGARAGDRLEARTLRVAFGDRVPPILLPKAVIGEYGGGTLVAGVLALQGGRYQAPPGFAEPDPELGVAPFDGEFERPPRRVLLTGLATGGAVAFAVLEAP